MLFTSYFEFPAFSASTLTSQVSSSADRPPPYLFELPTPSYIASLESTKANSRNNCRKEGNNMGVTLELEREFGYVILSLLCLIPLHIWQMLQVGKMRKKLKVYYPTMYSDEHQGMFLCWVFT